MPQSNWIVVAGATQFGTAPTSTAGMARQMTGELGSPGITTTVTVRIRSK